MLRRTTIAIAAALAVALLGACSSDDGSAATTTTAAETTTTAAAPLQILVTDDDGIGAPGIDALVNALQDIDGVEVHVVAPAENQSGSGDKTTPGGASYADGATASGVKGTAVAGFPADSVNVALDELKLTPDLVVSGVNKGQNLGPAAGSSGTIGAARTAIRRGIPAVASSAGTDELGFDAGAQLIVDWIAEHRAEIAAGTAQTDTVTSFNVPNCKSGEPGDLLELPLAATVPAGVNVFDAVACGVDPTTPPKDDIEGIVDGYLTVSQVPADL